MPRFFRALDQLVIHHSAGLGGLDTIEALHRSKGWPGVAYHWVIDREAKLHSTKPLTLVGQHAPPNAKRWGVCVIGDNTIEGKGWTTPQCEALLELVRACWIMHPTLEVIGHNDTKATACPGFGVGEWLFDLREELLRGSICNLRDVLP